jgi:CheY-like chemotaxis protein
VIVPDKPANDTPAVSVAAADPQASFSLLGDSSDMGGGASAALRGGADGQSASSSARRAQLGDASPASAGVISSGGDLLQVMVPGNAEQPSNQNRSPQLWPQDAGGDSPDDPNAAPEPGLSREDVSQSTPAQAIADGLPGDSATSLPSGYRVDSLSPGNGGQEVHTTLLSAGNDSLGQGRTALQNLLGSSSLRSNSLGDGLKLTSAGLRDFPLSSGNLSNQGTGFTVQVHSAPAGFTVSAVSLEDAYLNPLIVDAPLQFSSGWSGLGTVLESKDGDMTPGWLSRNPIAWIPDSPAVATLAYADAGIEQRDSFNPAALSVASERSVNASAGMEATYRGAQVQVYAVSTGIEAHFEMRTSLAGRETDLADKASATTGSLTSLAMPEIVAESGTRPVAEFSGHNHEMSIGITGLGNEASWQDLGAPSSRLQALSVTISSPSIQSFAYEGDVFASVPQIEFTDQLALFQSHVVIAGPAPGDAALTGTTGTTSVYLAPQDSSLWSILTTYALVIMPRQKKPQPTILVVDPDDATREALNVLLVREGYFVLPAASVRDAWGMFRTPHARIDLVLMDPHLPDVSGIHLCARLRELSPTLPVMVCAGEVEPGEVAQLLELGVRYYLRKPIAFEELLHTVKAILP